MATALTEQLEEGPFDPNSLWHNSAPGKLTTKWDATTGKQRWGVWRKHLARRKESAGARVLSGKRPPLLWGWPDDWRSKELYAATRALARGRAEAAAVATDFSNGVAGALAAVATAYALPGLAAKLSADAWWKLAESLHDLARDAEQLQANWQQEPLQLVRAQLLAGELPLALASSFPELRPMRGLLDSARRTLSEGLTAVTDGKGTPHCRLLGVLAPLLACWIRSRKLSGKLKEGAWSRAAEKQYRLLLRRAIRLSDGGGHLMLAGDVGDNRPPGLKKCLRMALELAGDKATCAAAASAISKSVVPSGRRRNKPETSAAVFNSTWSGMAVMSTGWSKSSARLAIAYGDNPHRIELHVGDRRLLAGNWLTETRCDGKSLSPSEAWEKQCWQSDKDCDYLEFGVDLADGLRLERQILLAKEDRVLFVTDIVLCMDRTPRELAHTLSLPLAHGVAWKPEKDTRDGALVARKQRAAVLPLGLAEWRSDPRGGSLTVEAGRLCLSQRTNGAALYCPLIIDLKPQRSKRERTWRQLTVAESLAVVPHDVAVGYRAQSGGDQWLVYRSLAPPGNRTVLGQNLSSEFFGGRFLTTGEVDEWIEIELE